MRVFINLRIANVSLGKLGILLTLITLWPAANLFAQCVPPQADPNCKDCAEIPYEITICHGGVDYVANVWICTQYATTTLIFNPCATPTCSRPVNAISWVRRICVPQDLKDLGLTAIYAAIVKGTNLCCNDFLGVKSTWPNCSPNSDCKTSTQAYCHILALPKCLHKSYPPGDGCYYQCEEGCNNYCMVDRRYCKIGVDTCCSALMGVCEYNDSEVCVSGTCNVQFDNCNAIASEACCK